MSRKRDEYRSLKAEHRVDISKVRKVEGNASNCPRGIYCKRRVLLYVAVLLSTRYNMHTSTTASAISVNDLT